MAKHFDGKVSDVASGQSELRGKDRFGVGLAAASRTAAPANPLNHHTQGAHHHESYYYQDRIC